jgi:hypothetical protein
MERNQMFVVYTNFVGAIYGFHHLNCDLILKFCWLFSRIKSEHFMHDVLLLKLFFFPSLFMFSTKTKNSNKYMVPKFNVNIQF